MLEGIKPGWIRLSFNYFIDEETFQYIVDAVHFVAAHGAKFLPLYRFHADDGLWLYASAAPAKPMSLDDVSYSTGEMAYHNRRMTAELKLSDYIRDAHRLSKEAATVSGSAIAPPLTTPDFEHLRWFPYPGEPVAIVPPA